MDGARLLWVGDPSERCDECVEAVDREGGWVTRVSPARLAQWHPRDLDVVVVHTERMDADDLDDVLATLRRVAPRVQVVVIAKDLLAERHAVRMIRDAEGARDRLLEAIASGPRPHVGRARHAVYDALVRMLDAPNVALSPKLRATVVLRFLKLCAKDAAAVLGIEANTLQGYTTQARDRLGWTSLDVATWEVLERLVGDLESLLADVLDDDRLAARIMDAIGRARPADRKGSKAGGGS